MCGKSVVIELAVNRDEYLSTTCMSKAIGKPTPIIKKGIYTIAQQHVMWSLLNCFNCYHCLCLLARSQAPPPPSSVVKTSTLQVQKRLGSQPTPIIDIPTPLPRLKSLISTSVPGMFVGKVKSIPYDFKGLSTSLPPIAEPGPVSPSKKTAHHQTYSRQKKPSLPSSTKIQTSTKLPEIVKTTEPTRRKTIGTTSPEELPSITDTPSGFVSHKRIRNDAKK